ncbi:MAG: hypothetical protein WA082_02285 [Candidatus Moraniibacteriota bacterium]
MRILFISEELGAAELALTLKSEGNEVRLFIHQPDLQDCFEGLIEKTSDWKQELDWVGKEGLIVFDDVGYGKDQDVLRQEGYRVVGGSEMGDRIEEDREYGQRILRECGIETLPCHNFPTAAEALEFVKSHPENLWVVKKNGGHISHYCYVPDSESENRDTIGLLERYAALGIEYINIQKKAEGVEIGIGRYFNGTDWVGPIELNIEHKGLFPGDIGPKTPEMGTLIWYEDDEQNRLFQSTLAKLKEYLKSIDFRGDIDLSCFVSDQHVWPLEFTSRFGNPATALQIELHNSPWIEFLSAVADGKSYDLDYKRGVGIVVTLAVPPFPYYFMESSSESSVGFPVIFSCEPENMRHYYFEEITHHNGLGFAVAGARGCVMHVGAVGLDIVVAREAVYERISKVHIPKMFYRHDIGVDFKERGWGLLKKWGWI